MTESWPLCDWDQAQVSKAKPSTFSFFTSAQLMWMANNGTLGASTLKGGYSAALTLKNVQRTAPFAVFRASPRLLVRARYATASPTFALGPLRLPSVQRAVVQVAGPACQCPGKSAESAADLVCAGMLAYKQHAIHVAEMALHVATIC